jgi:hypothetical protein
MTDIGSPAGDMCSTAYSINLRGQVVGASVPISGGEGVTHGWIWEKDSHITDLATLVLPGSDVTVTTAFFINDRSEIAGAGKLPNGDRGAIVLIPCDGDHDDVAGCEAHVDETVDVDNSSAVAARIPTEHSKHTGTPHEEDRDRLGSRYHLFHPTPE